MSVLPFEMIPSNEVHLFARLKQIASTLCDYKKLQWPESSYNCKYASGSDILC